MNSRSREELASILEKADPSRRAFLKRVLTGAGAAVLVTLPDTALLAQVPPQVPPGDAGQPNDGQAGT